MTKAIFKKKLSIPFFKAVVDSNERKSFKKSICYYNSYTVVPLLCGNSFCNEKKNGLIREVASLERGNILVVHLKSGLIRGVASLQRDILLVLHLIFWPDKRSGLQRGLSYKNGITVLYNFVSLLLISFQQLNVQQHIIHAYPGQPFDIKEVYQFST